MKRALLLLTVAGVGSLALAISANAWIVTEITVEAGGENRFGPRKVTQQIPEVVFQWNWNGIDPTAREHNVRQDKRLFYSGPPTTEDSFQRSISAGTFHYYCEVHGSRSGGMDGKVKVRPASLSAPDPEDRSFPVQWAIAGKASGVSARRGGGVPTETGDRFDVRFKVEDGRWRIWKRDTRKVKAQFGRNDNPVHVRNGREYKFKARSQKGSNDNKVSGWSPKLTIVGGAGP